MADDLDALRIVTATPDDAERVTLVRNTAADDLTRRFGPGHWSGTIGAHGVRRGIDASRVLLAVEGQLVVGTLRLATRKPWAIDTRYFEPSDRPLYLVDMAVLPERQGRGIGRLLVDAAVTTAAGWKADAIRLDAYDHAAGAGVFYEKCGFTEVGRASYREVPLIYYQMLLRGPS